MIRVLFHNFIIILIIFILTIILYYTYLMMNCYYGFFSQEGIIRRGSKNKRQIALTFDDGPSRYTEKILDILKNKKVKATFFLIGKNVKKYPNISKKIIKEGHDVGNHSFDHINLALKSKNTIIEQIKKTENIIKKVIGKDIKYFRPPRGIYNQKLRRILVKMKYKMILWTTSSHDWRNPGEKIIISRSTKKLKNGSILLFHDSGSLLVSKDMSREQTIKAVPKIIDKIKSKNYKLVTISKLLK